LKWEFLERGKVKQGRKGRTDLDSDSSTKKELMADKTRQLLLLKNYFPEKV
jgi:hypothetical protein